MHDEISTAALVAEARAMMFRATAIALPEQHLHGWSSLCAQEYSAGVIRLDALRRELQATLSALHRILQAG